MGSSERIFFLSYPYLFFFIENIRNMIKKNRYPGVDIKLFIAALHINNILPPHNLSLDLHVVAAG